MEFIQEPMSPQAAVEAGRLVTSNWDELLQLNETLTFNEEKLNQINEEAKSEMTADNVITWKEFVNTAAKYFPEFIDSEKAKDWNATMHFVIGASEEKMGEFTLKVENGEATYTDGLEGEATSMTYMDAETFISTLAYTRKESTGDLQLSDTELEGIAGGKGASACGAAASVASACGADACGAALGGATACGAAACGGAACAYAAGGALACGAAGCGAAAGGVGACGADVCGYAFCGIVLTGADACGADACGIDVIPIIPGI